MNKISNYNKFLHYKNGNLFLENMSLIELGEKFNTPLYCYSLSQIEYNYKLIEKSFKKIKPLICYAMKANFNSEIIKTLSNLGSGIDVVSMGELKRSLSNGVRNEKVVFSGVGKTTKELKFSILKKIKQINVESSEELEEIDVICNKIKKKINVCLRVNPDVDANTHNKISTGRSEDKFGIANHKIENIFQQYKKNKYINLVGLSIHIGSQIVSLQPFKKAFKRIKEQILKLKNLGYNLTTVDLGGGIGIMYNNQQKKLIDIGEYAKLVEDTFANMNLEVIIEPGRFLVGSSGVILTKIIRVKEGLGKKFLIIDAGMNNLIRPSMYGAYHNIIPTKISKKKKNQSYDIVGPICETGDLFGKNIKIQKLKKDEYIIICSTGAYGSCMSSKYNLKDEAKEIFLKDKRVKVSNS